MKLPVLSYKTGKTKKQTYVFSGINRGESYSMGDLEEAENISFDAFPAISAGRARQTASAGFDSNFEKIKVAGGVVEYRYAEGEGVYLRYIEEKSGAVATGLTLVEGAADGKRYAARAGNLVVVFPDKMYLDTKKIYSSFKSMEKPLNIKTDDCVYISHDRINTRDIAMYNTIKYNFNIGDVVTVDGKWFDGNYLGGYIHEAKMIIRAYDDASYSIITDPNTFDKVSNDQLGATVLKINVPDLMHLTDFSSRVWGCDKDGKIYASKYNDPINFEYFDLSSQDSFTIETNTPGGFVASAKMSDHVAFFKEDKIHRITGTKASNFRHSIVYTNGVANGSECSLAQKDGTLYFMSTDGIYTYGGGESKKISAPLGDIKYLKGVGAFFKDVYYISIKDGEKSSLYAFDTQKKIWLKDGDGDFKNAFLFAGETVFIDNENNAKKLAEQKDTQRDINVTFREFKDGGWMDLRYTKLLICARLQNGSKLTVEADWGFGFERVKTFTDFKKTAFEVRLKPSRTRGVRVRLCASPEVVITKVASEHFTHGTTF